MFFSFTNFFGPCHEACDCCNHNIDIELLLEDDQVAERKTIKKRFKNLLPSLRWKRLKEKCKKRKTTARVSITKRFRTIHNRVRRIGKKKIAFEVRREGAPQTTRAATDTNEQAGKHLLTSLLKSNNTDLADSRIAAVRQLLTTMFTDIVESDLTIAKHTQSTTQCFLVHPLADLDPDGSFLSRYTQPSPNAFDMDLNLTLTFISRWLQSSLTTMKALYPYGHHDLQMPFCVLETTQAGANTRARALQRRNPDGKVGIATLDFAALQREKLVASATHTYDFLRVPRNDFSCRKKLLVWTQCDKDEHSAKALRNAVLTVIDWEDTGLDTDAGSVVEELRVAAQTSFPDDKNEEQWARWMNSIEKKDSGTVKRAAGGSKVVDTTAQEIALTEEERYPRFLSL